MKITIVAGARPNFMKIAPVIRAINNSKESGSEISYRLVYTGKREDQSIDDSLFSDLGINDPDTYLGIEDSNFAELAARIMMAFDKELELHPSQVVLVVDDLTATMSCAITAKKRGLKVAHLVAGTRSFDINMPKEMNRIITDSISDYLFTAGSDANKNLNQSGTSATNVFHVGNILIDTIRYNRNKLLKPAWFNVLGLEDKNYILLTLNKRSLLKNKANFKGLMESIVKNNNGCKIIAPVRPYVEDAINALELNCSDLHVMPSQNYLHFGYIVEHAKLIISDSGNVAEESTFLGVPCISLSDYAEHPETYRIGTNELVGEDPEKLTSAMKVLFAGEWKEGKLPERWDGRTAERIIQILSEQGL